MTPTPTGHRRQVTVAGGHLDTVEQLLPRLNESLDDYWEHEHPTARDATLGQLTRLEHAAAHARAALTTPPEDTS